MALWWSETGETNAIRDCKHCWQGICASSESNGGSKCICTAVKVRESWYPIPDVCIYPLPEFEGRYPDRPPLLWIEVLPHDDRMVQVWTKGRELV